LVSRRSVKAGTPPGTLIYTGEVKAEVEITLIDYDSESYREFKVEDVEETFQFRDTKSVTWIDVVGLHDVDKIEKIGLHYGIHPLVLEDVLNVYQRPKVEDFGDYLFVVARVLKEGLDSRQVSFILGRNFVITFQEERLEIFEQIRKKIREGGKIRKMGTDYLLHSLIDAIIDSYFVILGKIEDEIAEFEDRVVLNPTPEVVQSIHRLKRNLIALRKSVWPLRDVVSYLSKSESDLISDETSIYFRDVYDHTIQVIDTIETLRELIAGMLEVYFSSISNRTNEIMKVLTIIATIFMPLTFITGIYGMNFRYMPELEWRYGYPFALFLMLIVSVFMIVYFRRKRWI